VVRIECAIKNYHWGKFGCDSKVAQFAKSNVQEFTVEEGKPYAEVSFSFAFINFHQSVLTKLFISTTKKLYK